MFEVGVLRESFSLLSTHWYIHLYLWLLLLDLLTGVAKAVKEKEINSTIGLNGLIRHFILGVIIVTISVYLPALNLESYAVTAVLFFIGQYVFSLVENLGVIGIFIPNSWIEYFQKIQKDKAYEIPLNNAKITVDNKDEKSIINKK